MKERTDLNKLAQQIFEANKAKGFHDKEISNETLLMLVITELSEAVDADRKGKRANVRLFNAFDKNNDYDQRKHQARWNRPSHDVFSFESCVKDTIEDELADTVIRLLDLAGLRDIGITADKFNKTYNGSFPENIYEIIMSFINPNGLGIKISVMIRDIEDLCKQMDIDLWLHVELKMMFNATRPHKHGKKY